jgi:hypothetical protein
LSSRREKIVPSYTSNSDAAVPADHLGKSWLLAVIFAALLLASMEMLWRSRGHEPSVVDDLDLWSDWRETASDAGASALVLLGDSRTNLGFNPRAFTEKYPAYRVVNLAINGKGPVAALDDLAKDPAFKGVVVCQVSEITMLSGRQGDLGDWVRYYHQDWGPVRKARSRVNTYLQGHMVTINPYFGVQRLLNTLWYRTLPPPRYIITRPDRTSKADYRRIDAKQQYDSRVKQMEETGRSLAPTAEGEWAGAIREVHAMVETLQARGAVVVFVRYPTSGEFRVLEDKYFPREKFWKVFVETVKAPAIHFEDVPSLSGFTCPDGVHLDYRDSDAFTVALGAELEKMGIVRPR